MEWEGVFLLSYLGEIVFSFFYPVLFLLQEGKAIIISYHVKCKHKKYPLNHMRSSIFVAFTANKARFILIHNFEHIL